MAVRFIQEGGVDGYMIHRADPRGIRVQILHDPRDGYRLSYDKEVIKEQLSLTEFIERLLRAEYQNVGFDPRKIKEETRQVLVTLSSGNQMKIESIATWLDHRYANLIARKKAVLMEHTHSINAMRVQSGDMSMVERRETISNRERSITQSGMGQMQQENMHVHQPMSYEDAYRVDDKEVYYLLT